MTFDTNKLEALKEELGDREQDGVVGAPSLWPERKLLPQPAWRHSKPRTNGHGVADNVEPWTSRPRVTGRLLHSWLGADCMYTARGSLLKA